MLRRQTLPLLAGLLLAAPVMGARQAADSAEPQAEIDRALRNRQYDQAVARIDAALKTAVKADREYLIFRRGLALLNGGKHEQALAAFERQLRDFPNGVWADKARFRQADAHVALKQFEAAERIYAERVRGLVGSERKARLAEVYLEFAVEYFKPPDALTKPDYAKALSFYERALELEPGAELRDEVLYKRALCNQKLSKWDDAARQYGQYLLVFDVKYRELLKMRGASAPLPAVAGRAGVNVVAARLGLAQCRLSAGKLVDARRAFQDLSGLLDEIDPDREQHRSIWIDATYLLSKTYQMPSPPNAESLTLGIQALESLLAAFPGSRPAIQAAQDIGVAYAHLGRHDEAIAALRALIDRETIRPGDDATRELAEKLSQDALNRIGRLFFAQKKYADAIGAWNQYVAKYPAGPHWSKAQQQIVSAEYQIGLDAVADERFDDARAAWTAFLQKYPLDGRAPVILLAFGQLSYVEQQKRVTAGSEADWSKPIGEWRRLVSKFPNTEQSGQAQFRIGRIYEEQTKNLPAAIQAYRALTWSKWAAQAKQRITEMNATRLTLLTERVYRSDEPARVRVDVRNVDRLTVKCYRIDMEDYFRKSHRLRGVETLDLLLIDPDKTFEIEVEGFDKYKPISQDVEIPFDGPGVWAVNVSNDTSKAAGSEGKRPKLEATTLVVRSDIDVIIKSSRRQMLVFAQNMLSNEPAPGVQVLVSDGKKVRLTGKTGDDGVWLAKDKVLKDRHTFVVYAHKDGHVAGNALSLANLGFSKGLQPRGYIYTDRPAYRPGDAVNVRGILREIKGGQYAVATQPDDKRLRWKLDVVDAKGRVLRTEEVNLNAYGSFATQFRIAEDAAVGQYKLIVRRPQRPAFSGSFTVRTYQLAKAFLRFDFDERVILRGGKIKGSLVAKYHYGEPVVGKTVTYRMHLWTGDAIARSGVTDKEGKIPFEFDSTILPEEGAVAFDAQQADLKISTVTSVFVAVRAFRALVTTPRPLYLSEEPVEVTVKTNDLEGKAIAKDMTLTALLRTRDGDRWAETKVESVECKTDETTGEVRAALKLIKGGWYVLRAEGKDRFGHVVTAEAVVQVSDDKDATRIRIFSDRQHYKVGESIGLDIHSRLTGEGSRDQGNEGSRSQLALITYEGEEIIGYRTLKLTPGHNRFDLPVDHPHFPNFAVAVSVMDTPRAENVAAGAPAGRIHRRDAGATRFHTASRPFTVERQLTITLKPDKTTYRPRDEMTVEITVTDQQGAPVQAEVGLAMIDDALLKQFPDATPPIVAFFQEGAYRQAELRTETSCTFRYHAGTVPMVTELLAEARRVQDEREAFLTRSEMIGGVPVSQAPPGPADDLSVGYGTNVEFIPLQNASAEDVSGVLESMYRGRPQAREQRVRVTADSRTNRLVVSGSKEQIAQIRALVAQLDGAGAARLAPAQELDQLLQSRLRRRGGVGLAGGGGGVAFGASRNAPQTRRFAGQAQRLSEGGLFGNSGWNANDVRDMALGVPFLTNGDVKSTVYSPRGYLADRLAAGLELRKKADDLNQIYALSFASAVEVERNLAELFSAAPPRSYFPEVAYWNPRIATDADGKATARIVVPDSSTTWRLVARGVTRETLVGRGQAEVVSRHDFFVELLTPPAFVEGDASRPLVRVHCLTSYSGKIDVTLTAGVDDHKDTKTQSEDKTQKRTIEVDGSGVYDVEFDEIRIAGGGKIRFSVTAETQEEVPDAKRTLRDALVREIPVRPWGMRIEAHAAGTGKDSDSVEIALPWGLYHDRRLTIAVGPSMQRWLIEEALEAGPRWEAIDRALTHWRVAPPRTHADTASALLGALYAADYVRSLDRPEAGPTGNVAAGVPAGRSSADLRLLEDRAAGLIAQLLSGQNDDGGWAWCGTGTNSDPWTTAQIAWALGKARRDGHAITDKPVASLKALLKKTFAGARAEQTELKAITLHGLAWIDKADFAHANRLYRNRQSLSNAALAQLALTFSRLERKSIAAELLGMLDHRMKEVGTVRKARVLPSAGCSDWMNSALEVTALALLAQLSVDARAANVMPMVNYLTGAARANGWRPHKARGTVLAALATYYGRAAQQRANYTLAVRVNGQEVRKLTSADAGSIRIDLEGAALQDVKQRIDFTFAGRGEYTYAVTFSGFSPSFPDPNRPRRDVLRVYKRRVFPPPLEYKGRVVKAGYSVARDAKTFENVASQQPVGAVIPVRVDLYRYDRSNNRAGDRDYVVVQETIPAGCRLLTETLNGQHLAYDYADNVLTLYYGSRRSLGSLRYKMVATTPGKYRLAPTVIRSLYRPDVFHVNKSDQTLTVLPRGQKSPDEYRLTPDEFYNLGRLHFDDGDYEPATDYLKQLIAGKWLLRDDPYRESVRMLLNAALIRDDAAAIVDYFEILKERYPGLVIPFADIVKVADAYARTDQHERAYLIYRATADASFVRDSNIGGVLQAEGRFLDSIAFLEELWQDYPDTPQVESIYYALSQSLYAQAGQAAKIKPRRTEDGKPAERVTRFGIMRETIRLLESFLTLHPESPIADEASYSLVNAYLDLDQFQTVLVRTGELIELFPKSKWLDRFRYIQALAHFNLGEFDKARELAEQVAKATYRDEQGVVRPSPNKWLALYIIGQIYHAERDIAKAIEYYKKVKTHFSDASEAVGSFERKFVELPEVTTFHPDEGGFRESEEWAKHRRNNVGGDETASVLPVSTGVRPGAEAPLHAKPFVRLDFRNIKSAVLQVYRVDLMKLALVEKTLTQITSVNLAGIKPILEKTVTLGAGYDYADKSVRVELDLKAPGDDKRGADGAYLIICRGDDLFSTGLVLVTPLAVEVHEDMASGRVRVNVVDAITRDGHKNVHVKVIGSGMNRFVTGETDLRGVYAADGVSGYPSAIARDADGHFAFYRSEGALLAMAPRPQVAAQQTPPRSKAGYRKNLEADNRAIQASNSLRLKSLLNKQQKGVQVQDAR